MCGRLPFQTTLIIALLLFHHFVISPPSNPHPRLRFEEGTSVGLRWDGWADWHGDANVIESFEHLHLVLWDNPHPEFTAGPAEKWVANSMVRLPGEGGVGGAGVVVAGAGCDTCNGTYDEDGAYKGRPLYTNKETGLQIWWNGQWRLGKTNDYYYQLDAGEQSVFGSPGEEDGSWEVATFQPHEGTCGPAPNLSVYSQTCP